MGIDAEISLLSGTRLCGMLIRGWRTVSSLRPLTMTKNKVEVIFIRIFSDRFVGEY